MQSGIGGSAAKHGAAHNVIQDSLEAMTRDPFSMGFESFFQKPLMFWSDEHDEIAKPVRRSRIVPLEIRTGQVVGRQS
jgi:hypothetical protein